MTMAMLTHGRNLSLFSGPCRLLLLSQYVSKMWLQESGCQPGLPISPIAPHALVSPSGEGAVRLPARQI
jgi:hypothetical protein